MVSIIALAGHGSRFETSAAARRQSTRPRNISRSAGRALEILAHAIEYLTDEYVEQASTVAIAAAQLEAIQILMTANRTIYFECPEKIRALDRLEAILRSLLAKHGPAPKKAA